MSETMEMISGGAMFGVLGVVSIWLIGFTRGRVSLLLGFIVICQHKIGHILNT